MIVQTLNPATELVIETYPVVTSTELEKQIAAAHASFQSWKKLDFTQRAERMLALAQHLRSKAEIFAVCMAQEMGKPLQAGIAEIQKCALVCEHYATHTAEYLAPQSIISATYRATVCYQPQGIVFAVMPWNFPFWQVFRFAIPNLMAGNVALLKHAPIVTGTSVLITQAFLDVGFPTYVFSHLILSNEQVSTVIAHPFVTGVTFTGSEQTGAILAATAGKYLKKVVMELGGSDPYLVLEDADLDLAARVIVASRLNNNGQTCIAAKRTIVVATVADRLIEAIIALVAGYRFGDPMDPETQLGPMARADLRTHLHQQVLESIAKGAVLRLGGTIPTLRGFYYPPTVLTHVRPGMPAFDDELFGPVFAITLASNEAHAIVLANQTRFGLGSAVFTRDLARGERIASQDLEAGLASVNGAVVSDPCLPFGGTKHSGYGRELAREGIIEFMNIKTVVVNQSKA